MHTRHGMLEGSKFYGKTRVRGIRNTDELTMSLAFVNVILQHLPCKHMLDTSCSRQPNNMPGSPCLDLAPPSLPLTPPWEEYYRQGQVLQIEN